MVQVSLELAQIETSDEEATTSMADQADTQHEVEEMQVYLCVILVLYLCVILVL